MSTVAEEPEEGGAETVAQTTKEAPVRESEHSKVTKQILKSIKDQFGIVENGDCQIKVKHVFDNCYRVNVYSFDRSSNLVIRKNTISHSWFVTSTMDGLVFE
jgi:hypothetical protein